MTNQDLNRAFDLIVKAKEIKGTSFVGVREYTNSKDEVSNQTFVVGFSYAKLLQKDLAKLTSNETKRQVVAMYQDNEKAIVKKAYKELVASLEKRTASETEKEKLREQGDKTIKLSDAQQDAYTHIGKGLKIHKETNKLFIYGLCVKKTILQKGDYPQTKSQKKTIIKKAIEKGAKLSGLKYKQFSVGYANEVKLQGATI